MMDKKWDTRFMQMAELVGTWKSCYKSNRQVGAIIVRDKRVIATGYNGAPAGIKSCMEKGECIRLKNNVPSGTRQEFCYAIHAEQNAIVQAAKLGISVEGATMYVTHQPCSICTKFIINAGIKRIVYKDPYPDEFAMKLIKESGIILEQYK